MQAQPLARESVCQPIKRHRSTPVSWLRLPACMIWLPLIVLPNGKIIPERRAHVRLDHPVRIARTVTTPHAANGGSASTDVAQIQTLVDDLRARLPIPEDVTVAVVPHNALVVSVERAKNREHTFLMSIDISFLELLDEDELTAAIAHELGHVWIFTHHPYLHTEPLANRIAMRLVSRESLAKVYDKLWARGGVQGDLTRFLGE